MTVDARIEVVTPLVWPLPDRLTEASVEEFLRLYERSRPETVVFKLGAWENTSMFGDARLLGAISRLGLDGTPIEVQLPATSLTWDRVQAFDSDSGRSRTPTERRMMDTLGGIELAILCSLDTKHNWWSTEASRRLQRDLLWGNGQERAHIDVVDDNNNLVRNVDFYETKAEVVTLLERMKRQNGIRLAQTKWDLVASFTLQAWLNAKEHGSSDLEEHMLRSLRYFGVRRVTPFAMRSQLHDLVSSDYVESYI